MYLTSSLHTRGRCRHRFRACVIASWPYRNGKECPGAG
nr:hypothetical protein JVH1_7544 [Rhodococcus sp. JVH1]